MRIHKLFLTITALAVLFCAGCSETKDKPLTGLVIKKIEIQGSEPEAVLTALASELNAQGATVAKDRTDGVVLIGKATIEPVDGIPNGKITINIRSDSGGLAALASYQLDPVFNNKILFSPLVLSQRVAKRVAMDFAEQYKPEYKPGTRPAPEKPATL
jgi:hypothetical protein